MITPKILALATLAFGTISLAHKYQVSFDRWLDPDCPGKHSGRFAENHLHDPHCKDFGDDPPYRSYGYTLDMIRDYDPIPYYGCEVFMYKERHCQGEAIIVDQGEASNSLGRCINVVDEGGARSASVKCPKRG
ncbi:hypothetical protein LTR85_007435 [Meristemomyces frigidus]|nr:hypothetical protein LTR85_007435 [Meristemomyces frigidus]